MHAWSMVEALHINVKPNNNNNNNSNMKTQIIFEPLKQKALFKTGVLDCIVSSPEKSKWRKEELDLLYAEKTVPLLHTFSPSRTVELKQVTERPSLSDLHNSTDFTTLLTILSSLDLALVLVAKQNNSTETTTRTRRFLLKPLSQHTAELSDYLEDDSGVDNRKAQRISQLTTHRPSEKLISNSSKKLKRIRASTKAKPFTESSAEATSISKELRLTSDQNGVTNSVDAVYEYGSEDIITVDEFKEQHDASIDTNDPSPPHVATAWLKRCTNTLNKDTTTEIVQKLLATPSDLKNEMERTLQEDGDKQKWTRRIQLQVMLRMQLHAMIADKYGNDNNDMLKLLLVQPTATKTKEKKNKSKKKRKRETSEPPSLAQDVITFLEMVSFLLGPDTNFAHFLVECFPRTSNTPIPNATMDIVEQVFEYFEVESPPTNLEDAVKENSKPKPATPPLSLPVVPADNVFAELVQVTADPGNSHDKPPDPNPSEDIKLAKKKNTLIDKPFSLTSRSKNALLKDGGKGRYVGSHFNSSLSNMSSLFRQVKQVTPKPRSVQQQKPKPSIVPKPKPSNRSIDNASRMMPPPRRIAETPMKCSLPPGRFVSETPMSFKQKSTRPSPIHLGGGHRSKKKPRKISLGSTSTSNQTKEPPQQSTHLVVQAALAASRKKR